jgi:putative solute:sodium symporter small subunit
MEKNIYWKKNIRYITILLSLWFIVSFGCGVLFVEQLNTIQIGGFKLGFWFAQQGSIFGFVVIIFTYIYLMNRLDNKLNKDN